MAATKTKNGNVAEEMANKAAAETKEWVDSVLETTSKVISDSKPVFSAQQKMLENSFGMWQEVSTSYLNFVTSATRQIMDQSLAVQKEMLAISETGLKQSVELLATEQAMVLEAAEALQGQMRAASERMSKSFNPTK
jgi:hypothetical protein